MKNINKCTQWKNGSVDVTFTCTITHHRKHLAQSGRTTQSAVDIFNTLRVFTKEPIREQKIKLECRIMYSVQRKYFDVRTTFIVDLRTRAAESAGARERRS